MVCPIHRTTTVHRPPISIEVDDIDVRGSICDTLLEHFESLIDKWEKNPLRDVLLREGRTPCFGISTNQSIYFLARQRFATLSNVLVVVVPALRRM